MSASDSRSDQVRRSVSKSELRGSLLRDTPPATEPQGLQPISGLEFVTKHWSKAAPVAVLLALLAGFSLLSEHFLTLDNMLAIFRSSAVLMVIALGSMVVILIGGIDLSVGSVLTLSAFVGATLASAAGTTDYLLVLPVVGLLCGAVNGAVVAYGRMPSFLVTLGGLFAYNGLANYMSDGQPISLPLLGAGDWFAGSVVGVSVIGLWAVGVMVFSILWLRFTRLGRHIYALGGNERTARLVGVPVERVKLQAFMISGLFAGFAGLMLAMRTSSASPRMGDSLLLPAIAAVVMGGIPLSGGRGGPLNVTLGVVVIAILSNGMVLAALNPHVQQIVMGTVVVLAVAITLDRGKDDVVK